MKHYWFRIIFLGSIILPLAACNQVDVSTLPDESLPPQTAAPPIDDTQTEDQKDSEQMTQPPSTGMEFLIEKAKTDLAQRLSISISEINLIEAREVVWPDASLGCPQPGMEYAQVLEDGALIVLEAQGATYDYHSGGTRGLFLCEKGLYKPEKPPQIDITNLTPQILDKNNPPPATPDQGVPPGEDN